MPAKYDMPTPMWRGDSYIIPIKVYEKDSEGEIVGPYSLVGFTLTFTMKFDYTAPNEDAEMYYVRELTEDSLSENGWHSINITHEMTSLMELGTYTYQIVLTNNNGAEPQETTFLYGRWTVGDS